MNTTIKIEPGVFKKHKVKLAYLFGSRAQGNAAKESDYDIAVLFAKKSEDPYFLRETAELSSALASSFPKKIDIVALNKAGLILKYEVISGGYLLYQEDKKYRIDFEVAATKGYIDSKYTRDIYYKALENRIKQGVLS